MAFRIVIILSVIALAYVGFEMVRFHWLYNAIQNPDASFQAMGPEEADLTVVEFLDYRCPNCQDVYGAVKELHELRPDIRIVARPLPYVDAKSEEITRLVLAAGVQGYFWEFHNALLEYPGVEYPESFLREIAMLYGLDYDELTKRSKSEEITTLLEENKDAAAKAGAMSVPSFMVGKIYYPLEVTEGFAVGDLMRVVVEAEGAKE